MRLQLSTEVGVVALLELDGRDVAQARVQPGHCCNTRPCSGRVMDVRKRRGGSGLLGSVCAFGSATVLARRWSGLSPETAEVEGGDAGRRGHADRRAGARRLGVEPWPSSPATAPQSSGRSPATGQHTGSTPGVTPARTWRSHMNALVRIGRQANGKNERLPRTLGDE